MAWFGDSGKPKPEQMTHKSSRQECWDSRDKLFACLDKNDIVDADADKKLTASKCGAENTQFEKQCIESWVSYFKSKRVSTIKKETRIKELEAQGAIRLDVSTSFK